VEEERGRHRRRVEFVVIVGGVARQSNRWEEPTELVDDLFLGVATSLFGITMGALRWTDDEFGGVADACCSASTCLGR